MASCSSSSASLSNRRWKHSVFLSFSGEDVRSNFISHLYEGLSEISADVFIDYRLEPAKEIAPALMRAIEESRIAVIIFSKSYASSTWCLDELEKIIESTKIPNQLDVIPVFYNVDASHVHNPTIEGGIYAQDFARHEKSFKEKLEKVQRLKTAIRKMPNKFGNAVFVILALEWHKKDLRKKMQQVQRWKTAMIKAANFKGWDSQSKEIRSDAELKDRVVRHVLEKLIQMSPSNLEGLVGIDSRIDIIKELLSLESNDVYLLGIWGMGGIGKTTTAKALFNQIRYNFETSCILENIRQESEKAGGLDRLREELLYQILGRKYMVSHIAHSYHLKVILSRKKALLILDDLTNLKQLKVLLGHTSWFGPGSRIIITSKDKEMVGKKGILGESVHVMDPYEVKELTFADSFKLFSQNAFERKHPTNNFWAIACKFVKYAGGVPLALEVLGRHLLGKSKERWESCLINLQKGPHQDIQSVLKLSYDDLSPDGQEMFLDVACFLTGEDFHVVEQIFERCEYSIEINDLIDKCLMTKSDNSLEMHPLLQQMGKEIERRKSRDASKRTRLWDHKDVCKVFKRKFVCESIESISLDMFKTTEVLQLDSHAFERIPNLKFLRFQKSQEKFDPNNVRTVELPDGLVALPDGLLYLYWHGYPLKYLPANFNPTNLALLNLPYSNLQQLWEYKKELEIGSQLEAPTNLASVITNRGAIFNKVPSSMRFLSQVCELDLRCCKNLTSFPCVINLTFLQSLNLSGCTQLLEFPHVPRNIKILILDETGIEEIPLSVEELDNLKYLNVARCPNLKNVPFSIFMGKSSCYMDIEDSPNVNITFSESKGYCLPNDLNHLSIFCLDLSHTNIQSLPDGFSQLFGLETLLLNHCKHLRSLPELPPNLRTIHAKECRSLEAISSFKQLLDLEVIDLMVSQEFIFSNCLKVDEASWSNLIPDIILRIQSMAKKAKEYHLMVEPFFRITYPGSKILDCEIFASSYEASSSIIIWLPPYWYTSKFLGFILCVVFVDKDDWYAPNNYEYGFDFHCEVKFQNNTGDSRTIMCCSSVAKHGSTHFPSKHVTMWYDHNLSVEMAKISDWFCTGSNYKGSFTFYGKWDMFRRLVVKKCGVLPIFDTNKEINGGATPSMWKNPVEVGSKYWRDENTYCSEHYGPWESLREMISTNMTALELEHQLQ